MLTEGLEQYINLSGNRSDTHSCHGSAPMKRHAHAKLNWCNGRSHCHKSCVMYDVGYMRMRAFTRVLRIAV